MPKDGNHSVLFTKALKTTSPLFSEFIINKIKVAACTTVFSAVGFEVDSAPRVKSGKEDF